MLYNPSFAGSAGQGRIISMNGMLGMNGSTTHYLSYDQFVPEIYGGVGLYVNRSNLTSIWKANQNTGIGLIYSPKFTYNENSITIAPSVSFEGGYQYFNYNLSNVDDNDDDTSRIERGFFALINSGVLINNRKSFIGISWSDVSRTRISLMKNGKTRFNGGLQLGRTFSSSQNNLRSFTPVLAVNVYKRTYSGVRYNWIANFNFKRDKFLWGVNVRSGFSLGGMIGYQSKALKLGFAVSAGERAYNYSNYYELAFTTNFKGMSFRNKNLNKLKY